VAPESSMIAVNSSTVPVQLSPNSITVFRIQLSAVPSGR
jgi:hypothetical protein